MDMGGYDEWKVAETIDTIFVQEDGLLEIEYKEQELSYNLRLSL